MKQQEFANIVTPFKDKIFRVAKRLLVSIEEAEDATQEVLTRLWVKNEQLLRYRSIEALAMTITKNYCLDQLKSKRASNLQLVHNNYNDESVNLSKEIENKDSLQWVEKIIDKLPEQQRLIVQMREIEEYEFSEIADILEMNETAVRVALSRARKVIREKMLEKHQYGIEKN